MKSRIHLFTRLTLALLLTVGGIGEAMAQAYRIKPLGNLGGCTASVPLAYGFNKADQVTGQACNVHGDLHAFFWKNDGNPMLDLGPAAVGSTSTGYAISAPGLITGGRQDGTGEFAFVSLGNGAPMINIPGAIDGFALNDSGQVTGEATNSHAFLWKNDGSALLDLGTAEGNSLDYSYGVAINATGQVTGTSGYSSVNYAEAFIWKNNGTPMLSLGRLPGGSNSGACCINATGQVAGQSDTRGHNNGHAFLWRNDGNPMVDLGTLGGYASNAYALNDAGQVAGKSFTKPRTFLKPHAFVWLNNGTPMKDLGTFGGTSSQSNDINASGQVTGTANLTGDSVAHAFLWRNDGTGIQDLNTLIDPTDPLKSFVTLTGGAFINDIGDIVAEGTDSRTGSGLYLLQGSVLTLTPRSLAFGNVAIHTTSAAKSVTVTNTSARAAAITGVTFSGSNANQFSRTHNCGSSLAGHAMCVIKVTFKPTARGAKSATLNVNGGGGGLRTVSLTGTGT